MTYVNKISDLPAEPHFAIIRQTSVYVPGDERSHTNPGHGYPASTEYFISYQAFAKREEWEAEIVHLTERREMFKAVQVAPAKIATKVAVTVT